MPVSLGDKSAVKILDFLVLISAFNSVSLQRVFEVIHKLQM